MSSTAFLEFFFKNGMRARYISGAWRAIKMLKKSKIIYILRGIIVILWHIWLKFHRSAQKGEEVKTRALNNSVVCGVFITLSMVILSTYRDALFCVMLLFLGYQIHFQKLLWIFFLEKNNLFHFFNLWCFMEFWRGKTSFEICRASWWFYL